MLEKNLYKKLEIYLTIIEFTDFLAFNTIHFLYIGQNLKTHSSSTMAKPDLNVSSSAFNCSIASVARAFSFSN